MLPYRRYPSRQRGGMILAAMFVIIVMAMMATSVVSHSLQTYRDAKRLEQLDQVKLKAESEMEVVYYNWKKQIFSVKSRTEIPGQLTSAGITVDETSVNTATMTPTLAKTSREQGEWTVSRSLRIGKPPATGQTNGKLGQLTEYTALTRAVNNHPTFGNVEYRMGRRFAQLDTTLFQFSVFYQDVMEFSAGSAMTIKGKVSGNNKVYMSSKLASAPIVIRDEVTFYETFNGCRGPNPDTTNIDLSLREVEQLQYRSTGSAFAPIFDPTPETAARPADQAAQRAIQVKKMGEKENFLGGINVDDAKVAYGPITTLPDGSVVGTGAYPTENDIYRSVVAPLPKKADGTLIDEDPTVKATRMYSKAGVVIEVRDASTISASEFSARPVDVYVGVGTGRTKLDYASTSYLAVVATVNARKNVYDSREQTNVKVTTLNVGQFASVIEGLAGTSDPLLTNYNGVVYVYDPNAEVDSPTSAALDDDNRPDLNAVRLTNGYQLPWVEKDGKPVGFTLATDNGLYVQGDYNTVQNASATADTRNMGALLADAVTVLSGSWDDDKSGIKYQRDAITNAFLLDASGNKIPETVIVGGVTSNVYYKASERVASDTVVNSAILSGNTASSDPTGVGTINSGGVQNLVRLMENWSGRSFTMQGSLGQLFASKHFTAAIRGTGDANGLYFAPATRNLTFDEKLAESPPNQSPTTTKFYRGDYFIWHKGNDPTKL